MSSRPDLPTQTLHPFSRGFSSSLRPGDRRLAWEWCEEHVIVDNTSPMPGRWRSDSSPWVREVMEVFQDNRVNDIAVCCSAQSSKTQTIINLACWAISEDPGPALWVLAAKDEVKDFVRDRVSPTINACKPVLAQLIIEQRLGFLFVAMPLYFSGAGSQSKLQSKPIRWLFLDEVRNYPPGALETVLKRTRSFWNSKRLIISTPDMENDAVDRAFKAGDQRVFHFSCPSCRHLQPLTFEQLKWDTNDLTKPSGAWDFDALAATIRYVCVSCGHVIRDTPQARKLIARTGQFVRLNMRAPHHRVSFHWNALLPPWVSWRSLVEEFLQARAAARNGDIKPLKTFVNESLGESWKDQLGVIDEFDFLLDRRANYVFGDPWPEEEVRFLSADRQAAGGEHYWFVVRAFARGGRSRLIAYGRCNSLMDLEETRKRHNVHAVNSVIDSGYRASEVYRFCRGTGWKPFKGEGDDFFLHKDPVSKKTVRRVWETSLVDPAYGTRLQGRVRPIKLWRWSNPGIKDLLFEQMTGVIGEWTIPSEVGRDYLQQLSAENRVEERDARGYVRYRWHQKRRDNHLLDCELQIAVVAVVTGMIASSGSRRTFDTPPGVNGAVEPENVPGVSPAESAGGWDYSQGGS